MILNVFVKKYENDLTFHSATKYNSTDNVLNKENMTWVAYLE